MTAPVCTKTGPLFIIGMLPLSEDESEKLLSSSSEESEVVGDGATLAGFVFLRVGDIAYRFEELVVAGCS